MVLVVNSAENTVNKVLGNPSLKIIFLAKNTAIVRIGLNIDIILIGVFWVISLPEYNHSLYAMAV